MKRKFEMYQYRQVLVRMRQGDSDRDIDRSNIMGRKKLTAAREIATGRGWLSPYNALPSRKATLAACAKTSIDALCPTSNASASRARQGLVPTPPIAMRASRMRGPFITTITALEASANW